MIDVILLNTTVLSQLGVRSSLSHQELSGDPQYAIIAPMSLMMPVALLPLAVIVRHVTIVMPLCRVACHRCRAACLPAAPCRRRATRRCCCAARCRAGGHLAAPCPGWPFSVAAVEGFCLIHQINVESNAFMLTSRLIKFGLVHQRQRWPKWCPLSSTMANKVHTSR